MYNVIDENNYYYMHLRFVAWEKPTKGDVYFYLWGCYPPRPKANLPK